MSTTSGCGGCGNPDCLECFPIRFTSTERKLRSGQVVWLEKHRSATPISTVKRADANPQSIEVLACNCGNKTFALIYTGDTFPRLQCCVCGTAHGHLGWVDHDAT